MQISINTNSINTHFNKKNNSVPQFNGITNSLPNKKIFKNSIKIIFADVDGTLSEHSDLMTRKTIESINRLQDNNIPVVLTTARCYQDTIPILEQLSRKPDYTITLQGGCLTDRKGNNIFNNIISQNTAKNLIQWFNSINPKYKNSHLVLYFDEQPYSTSNIQFPWKARTKIQQVPSFNNLLEISKLQKAIIYKSNMKSCPNYNSKELVDLFESSNNPELKITSSSNLLELQNKWVAKDKAIEFLLRILKIEPKNAMTIGDSFGDIEMLDFVRERGGLAVAMGNSNEIVKKHANAITTSVTEDGFSHIIDKIF